MAQPIYPLTGRSVTSSPWRRSIQHEISLSLAAGSPRDLSQGAGDVIQVENCQSREYIDKNQSRLLLLLHRHRLHLSVGLVVKSHNFHYFYCARGEKKSRQKRSDSGLKNIHLLLPISFLFPLDRSLCSFICMCPWTFGIESDRSPRKQIE